MRFLAGSRKTVWEGHGISVLVCPRSLAVTSLLLLLVVCLGAASLGVGAMGFGPDLLLELANQPPGSMVHRVFFDIRLPRTLTAILVGAALGASGLIFQSISRNALGSPDIIGFTTGAATGAIVQIVLFSPSALGVAVAAIVGGLVTALVVYGLSVRDGSVAGYRLILVGIGIGAILSAVNGLLLVKGDLDNAVVANLWLAGSLDARNWGHVIPVGLGCLVLMPVLVLLASRLQLMEMGDDTARQLGVRVEAVRLTMVLCAVALAGLATGAAGPVAFIALAAPQLVVRLLPSGRLPVIGAAAMGALLMVVTDLLSRLFPLEVMLPIGRMTGVIGGIYLIWLLGRVRGI